MGDAITRLMIIATTMQEHVMLIRKQEQTAESQHAQESQGLLEKRAAGLTMTADQSLPEIAARFTAILLPIPARHEWLQILRQHARGLSRILSAQLCPQTLPAGKRQAFPTQPMAAICVQSTSDAQQQHPAEQRTEGTAPAIPQHSSVL